MFRIRIVLLAILATVLLAGLATGQADARKRRCAPHCHRAEREREARRQERAEQRELRREEREQQKLENEQQRLEEEEREEREEEEAFQEEPEGPAEEGPELGETEVGIDTGGWTGSLISELVAGHIGTFRVQSQVARTVAQEAPGRIGSIVFGQGGSIGAINPASYAAEVANVSAATHPQAVEVLNEPGNPMFWSDPANYLAYAKLVKAVHEALQALPASSRPAELCSWDGGEGPNSLWGLGMAATGALAWCDGVTAHAYGGKTGSDGGALGGRRDVELAHLLSGLPVYVTEIGWPTAVGQPPTGDSQQWTEAQQAQNIAGFAAWAAHTGYVPMVTFFNAVDYGTNTAYGIETSGRRHKLSFATLAELSG